VNPPPQKITCHIGRPSPPQKHHKSHGRYLVPDAPQVRHGLVQLDSWPVRDHVRHVQIRTRLNIERWRKCRSPLVYTVLQKPSIGRVVSVGPGHVCGTGAMKLMIVCGLGFMV